MHVSVSEQRFLDGLGQQYLQNGEVRCHGVSKTKLRLARLEKANPELTSDDVWPEAQCTKAAEPGTYLCAFHGGKTPSIKKRNLFEYMPPALQEKYLSLQDINKLMDRSQTLAEIAARKAELYEMLDELVLGNEAYGTIREALDAIESGNVVRGGALLQTILMNPRSEASIHAEMRELDKLEESITRTHFGIMKDMRDMATSDQMSAMKEEFFNIVKISIDRNIKDQELKSALFDTIFELMNKKKISLEAMADD